MAKPYQKIDKFKLKSTLARLHQLPGAKRFLFCWLAAAKGTKSIKRYKTA